MRNELYPNRSERGISVIDSRFFRFKDDVAQAQSFLDFLRNNLALSIADKLVADL